MQIIEGMPRIIGFSSLSCFMLDMDYRLVAVMAANFNIVPAALLELPDQSAVIKAQIPTGILLLGANIILLYLLMF